MANLTEIYICFSFGILPHRRPINVVIGSPIEIPNSVKNPTDEEVSENFSYKYNKQWRISILRP